MKLYGEFPNHFTKDDKSVPECLIVHYNISLCLEFGFVMNFALSWFDKKGMMMHEEDHAKGLFVALADLISREAYNCHYIKQI